MTHALLRPVAAAAVAAAGLTSPALAAERPVVVELFTSQGCSSCPPADALMEDLAMRDDLIALSFNVDIWDYLGWKDTLARPEHTARQRRYARRMPQHLVYTPQSVIGGLYDVVGSRGGDVEEAVGRVRANRPPGPEVAIETDGGTILVKIGAGPEGAPTPAKVLFGRVSSRIEVEVGGGENGGRRIAYTNVVHDFAPIATWTGAALEVSPPPGGPATGFDRLVAILQVEGDGPVLGAALVPSPDLVRAGQ